MSVMFCINDCLSDVCSIDVIHTHIEERLYTVCCVFPFIVSYSLDEKIHNPLGQEAEIVPHHLGNHSYIRS